jgi:hypothetical protein
MREGTPSGFSTMIDMRAVFEERHVLDRQDARDDALVAVTAGHLVARLQLALHRDEDLDHLEHARRQLVAALQLLDGRSKRTSRGCASRPRHTGPSPLRGSTASRRRDGELPPLATDRRVEQVGVDLAALLEALRTGDGDLTESISPDAPVDVTIEDGLLVVTVLGRRSISSRSIARARSSLSTPWRLKTRTSTIVPARPGAGAARCRARPTPFHRRWRAGAFLPASSGFRPSA